jgi:uncharacterized protein (DUF1501 family)
MSASRRDFLKNSGLVVMAGAAGVLSAEQVAKAYDFYGKGDPQDKKKSDRPQPPTLVTIFLRGGADMLNTFVPFGDPLYHNFRPKIALRADAKGKGAEKGCVPILKSDYWGINVGMGSLIPLIDKGQCVPIFNVGSTDGTRSHFSAQDYMERGVPGNTLVSTGWLNRYLEATRKSTDAPLRGISAQTLLPRALRGNYPVLAGSNHTTEMDLFAELYNAQNMVNSTAREGVTMEKGSSLEGFKPAMARTTVPTPLNADQARDIITASGSAAVERIRALDAASQMQNDANYPNGGLSGQLSAIARVIKANVGLEVAQADLGGWDMHSDEGGAQGGRMASAVLHLSECINAFVDDLGPQRMKKVMVLVMTEFGRTVHENGASGTDHGRGSYMLAVGGMLNGGKYYGKWNGMGDTEGGRFLPVHTDFRAVFAESLIKLFHVDPFQMNIFPGYKPAPDAYQNFMKQLDPTDA